MQLRNFCIPQHAHWAHRHFKQIRNDALTTCLATTYMLTHQATAIPALVLLCREPCSFPPPSRLTSQSAYPKIYVGRSDVDQLFVSIQAPPDRFEAFKRYVVAIVAQRVDGSVLTKRGAEGDSPNISHTMSRQVQF